VRHIAAALCAAMPLCALPAHATPPPVVVPVETENENGQPQAFGPFAFLSGASRSNALFGDMWGLRTFLSRYGLSFGLSETSEVLGNVTGGTRRGFDYDGLTQMVLQLDTQRAFGWHGGNFNVSALDIHGRNLSADNLDTLQTASGIEADRGVRLWELWYQQKFLDEDRLDVKIGQQSLDQEFMVSQDALVFVNTMFGWPMLPSADLPGGGPAYPLSALGVRVRARPIDSWTFLFGAFNGSPVASNSGDPQRQDPSGTSFPLNGGLLAIAEAQYTYPSLGALVMPGETAPLARVYRFGAWYDSEPFADERLDTQGVSLASPASNGLPLEHRGDFAIYAVADQMVWNSAADPNRTLSVFGRVMGTTLGDRNLIDFSMNAGLVLRDPFTYRTDDTLDLGMGYTHVSGDVAAFDRDVAVYTLAYMPARGGETFVEATYQYQLVPWCQFEPDLQYVINPGGGLANPDAPVHRILGEFVLGLRTNIAL
jgi:porin